MTKRFQALAVWQREIEEDYVEVHRRDPLQPRGEEIDVRQLEWTVPAVAEQVAHDPDVVRIVLDEEDLHVLFIGGAIGFHASSGGSSTSSNQYLQIVFRRSTRPRNVTGLVI